MLQRLVSGKKARTNEGPHNLDLIRLTDRVIIMGWPAAGLEGVYRNQRKDVLSFLEANHAGHYRIFNLCPRNENSYAASEFDGRVSRFPFPDHFAPPLSMLPLAVHGIARWIKEDERNVAVIHCKAGKGRSGTVAVAYLLSLPGLPTVSCDTTETSLPPIRTEVPDVPSSIDSKLEHILKFHTSRRMQPGSTSRGVSISSQQRWLRYYARTLSDRDPRPPSTTSPIRLVRLEYVKISGPGMSGVTKSMFGGRQLAVQLRRYRDSTATSVRERELALQKSLEPESSSSLPRPDFDDSTWDDEAEMLVRVGDLVQRPAATGSSSPAGGNDRTLYPIAEYLPPSHVDEPPFDQAGAQDEVDRNAGGILLDADREVQFWFLIGETGKKHSKLPSMASLAIVWFIPSFESTPGQDDALCTMELTPKDLDFYKPAWGVEKLEIAWRWVKKE